MCEAPDRRWGQPGSARLPLWDPSARCLRPRASGLCQSAAQCGFVVFVPSSATPPPATDPSTPAQGSAQPRFHLPQIVDCDSGEGLLLSCPCSLAIFDPHSRPPAGANVNAAKLHETALHHAAKVKNVDLIEMLVQFGGNIYARDNRGRKPSDYTWASSAPARCLEHYESECARSGSWRRVCVRWGCRTVCGSSEMITVGRPFTQMGPCDYADTGPDLQSTEDKPPAKTRPCLWGTFLRVYMELQSQEAFKYQLGKKSPLIKHFANLTQPKSSMD